MTVCLYWNDFRDTRNQREVRARRVFGLLATATGDSTIETQTPTSSTDS